MDYGQIISILIRFLVILMVITLSNLSIIDAYDSATSCDPRTSHRRARAQILSSIPCDLTSQSYCNLPGKNYPWRFVRRFVTENQGLMRRMYGDLRHISVLKTEIDSNDIELNDIQETQERYSRKTQKTSKRKTKYLHSEYQIHRNNDVLSEPYFRPTSTSTPTTSSTTTTTATSSSTSTTESSSFKPDISLLEQFHSDELGSEELINTSVETNSVFFNVTQTETNIIIVEPPNLTTNKSETATISTTLKLVPQLKIEDSTIKTLVTDANILEIIGTTVSDIDTTLASDQIDKVDEDYFIASESAKVEKFEQKEENLGEEPKQKSPISGTMEGQLFQDVVEKNANSPTIAVKGKGVNACPVKEEVVAPFWANNTRGEVLALLNLYPFEQYVHWEKCTHEHKQMYCREGCRCEQQYSLHRLLAYDPHNDCRGIFSDWFRFPSCCVCKCYDVPGIEFRGTSRSPRSVQANAAEEELRKAIYDHATEDWYRPRDDFYSTK